MSDSRSPHSIGDSDSRFQMVGLDRQRQMPIARERASLRPIPK